VPYLLLVLADNTTAVVYVIASVPA
jgi:hypothetical protein